MGRRAVGVWSISKRTDESENSPPWQRGVPETCHYLDLCVPVNLYPNDWAVNMFAVWPLIFGVRNPRLPETHTRAHTQFPVSQRSESDCIIKHSWKLPS